nr:reverse transcriptase domain-containing protein [Tanacetum cinerariifolium]
WIEWDVSLGGEMDEPIENPGFDEEEELNEFMDDDQDEEVEEWLMAPVMPPRATVTVPITYEFGGPFTAIPVGHPLTSMASGVATQPQVIDDLCVRMSNLEYRHEELVKKMKIVTTLEGQVQTLQTLLHGAWLQNQQLQTRLSVMENREGTLISYMSWMEEHDVSDGPLIAEAEVEGYWIRRVFVDQRAAVQVMFEHFFDNLSPDIKARLAPTQMELLGFLGEQLIPIGKIELKVCFGEGCITRNTIMKFTVVRASSPYNIILGLMGLLELRAVSSTIHDMMKFPTPKGIATICARAKPIYKCRWSERKVVEQEETIKETEETRNQSMEEEEKVLVNPAFPEQTITIAQKLRVLGTEKSKMVTREMKEWVKAGIVRSVKYLTWISNPVLVRGAILPVLRNTKNITKENKEDYRWTEEAKHAFQELKKFILELPTLTTPELKETLFVYLATSHDAVITDQPIQQILNKPEVSRKLAKYVVELGAYNITYIPRTAVKGQILVYFINEILAGTRHVEACNSVGEEDPKGWTLYTDEASSQKGVGAALLAGLKIARKMKVQTLDVQVDSKLVAYQMNGEFVASNERMEKYLAKAKEQAALFKKFSIKNILRNPNQKADVLSKLASVAFNHLTKKILVEVLNSKSVDVQEVSMIMEEEEDNWMTPIIKCLEEGVWPTDENDARTLRMNIGQYVVEDGVLFKKSYLSPMLRCVGLLQANYIIREVHEGAYGMHAGARSVVPKIMRQGYYWPTMHGDTKEVVDKCDSCQIHSSVPKLPKTRLTSVMSPWPFYQWGLDILRPLPKGPASSSSLSWQLITSPNG